MDLHPDFCPPMISVPERNRAIKKLLQAAYGASIKVKAGTGSAHHWVHVTIDVKPEELAHCRTYAQVCDAVIALCRANGIELHTFYDDVGDGTCLNVTLPRSEP